MNGNARRENRMILYERKAGLAARSQASETADFGGCEATPTQVAQTERLEVWCTQVTNHGKDYCIVKLFRKDEDAPFLEKNIPIY